MSAAVIPSIRIAVVGGGVTGSICASILANTLGFHHHQLQQQHQQQQQKSGSESETEAPPPLQLPKIEIDLIESASQLGGRAGTLTFPQQNADGEVVPLR